MDLKSYLKQQQGKADSEPTAAESSEPSDQLRKQTEELSKKSRSELMDQLMSEVKKGKNDGSFSADALNDFTEKLSPMLSREQRERLIALKSQLDQQI